jgi:DNA-binding CsgD family transcriptional regulator/tetratricopeptide (TPR) repeat protein
MELVDAVGRLVDKSLLEARTDGDGRTRYHMLETIRRYALELQEPEERDEAMARSMTHLLALAEEATTRAESSDWPAWLDRLVAEHDNLRVVLNWARERNHHDLPALVIALGWFWQRRGDPSEGRRWLEAATALASDDRSQLEILRWATNLAAYENDVAAALRYAEQAMLLADRLGDVIQTAHARLALGNLIFYQQAVPSWALQASQHYEVAERLFDEAGLTFRAIAVQLNRSMLDLARGDVASGRQRALQAHERARAGGWVHWEWRARMRFGIADFLDEDDEEAERHFAACVRYGMTSSEFGNRLRVVLQWLAAVAARRGELDRSARLAGAAGVVGKNDAAGSFLPQELLSTLGEWQGRVRRELGDTAYEQHLESGGGLSRADLRRLVQRDGGDRSDVRPMLSGRELQVVELVAEGLTNREVAERLHLSPRTVDAHLDHVRNKLGLRTRAQVVRWLVESRQLNGGRSGGGEPGELE